MLERADAATPQQFFIFIGLFLIYCLFMSQAWSVAGRYQALKQMRLPAVTYGFGSTSKSDSASSNAID